MIAVNWTFIYINVQLQKSMIVGKYFVCYIDANYFLTLGSDHPFSAIL